MTTGSRGRQMHDHKSLPGVPSSAWFPLLLAAVTLVCAPAAWPQAEPALPALSADQVVQRLMEKNQERAAELCSTMSASVAIAWSIAASPPLRMRRWKWK